MKRNIQKIATYALLPLILTACETPSVAVKTDFSNSNSKVSQTVPSTILQKTSPHSFAVTESKIRDAINARPLNLFGEVPHSKGAAKAGLELAPSTLFIFGNPKGGTPLMARNPEIGIELPLKIHVFEKDGQVTVSYTNIAAVVESHGGDASALPTPKIAEMLEGLVGSVVAE
jgi:uncharacterized protein (DUF302 family)